MAEPDADPDADSEIAPARTPSRRPLIAAAAVVAVLAVACGVLGYLNWQNHRSAALRALMVQTGRQVAVNLTTIDYTRADADVKRILDSATGGFHDDFQARSGPFIDVVRKVESRSVGTVTEAALEGLEGDEGTVLVAVTVATTTKGQPDPRPRFWRMRLTVEAGGDAEVPAKVSKVDFVA